MINQENALTYLPTVWSYGRIFLSESPSSQRTPACVIGEKKPTVHCTNTVSVLQSVILANKTTHFCGIKGSSFPADTWVGHVGPKQNPTKPSNSTKFLERFSHLCASPLLHLEKASTWSVHFIYSDDPFFLSSNYRIDGLEVCLNPNTYLCFIPAPPQADFQLTSFPPSWLLPILASSPQISVVSSTPSTLIF